jgi:hypothetical protein
VELQVVRKYGTDDILASYAGRDSIIFRKSLKTVPPIILRQQMLSGICTLSTGILEITPLVSEPQTISLTEQKNHEGCTASGPEWPTLQDRGV